MFPVGAVAGFLEPVRVEDLLELMAHGNRQVGLAEVQSFGDERESGVSDYRFGTDEVGEESVKRRLFENDVSFDAFAAETVRNERATHSSQELRQGRSRRSDIDKDVIALRWSRRKDFLTQQRRKKKRVALPDRSG